IVRPFRSRVFDRAHNLHHAGNVLDQRATLAFLATRGASCAIRRQHKAAAGTRDLLLFLERRFLAHLRIEISVVQAIEAVFENPGSVDAEPECVSAMVEPQAERFPGAGRITRPSC
ncbi:hypothetical protein L0Z33_29625, partial [Burkholderia multivorans]|uniref:hypothetical protein n=1 Tax=Burkholderia multivorans TaxID=87883 RepID=UPI00207C97FD